MATKVQHSPDTSQQDGQDAVPHLRRQSVVHRDGEGAQYGLSVNQNANRRESRFRRPSVQYSRRMSTVSRTSMSGLSLGFKQMGMYPVKLQNTYKTEPDKNESFRPAAVRDVIKEVLDECLNGEVYNATQCRNLTQMLTEVIKGRVKDMGFNRYKLICTATIGQDAGQGVSVVSRCLWNKDSDNFAEATYHKDGLYAVAAVYAVYFE